MAHIELYDDASPDRDYASSPATFVDGTPFLIGTLSSFFLGFDPSTGNGAYEGNCAFTSGSGLTTLNQLNAGGYTFGGLLDSTVSSNIPAGYQLAVDGSVEVEVIVGVEEKSWGAVKDLFRK